MRHLLAFIFLGGGRGNSGAFWRFALGTLGSLDCLPELPFRQLQAGKFDELLADGLEFVAVRKDLAALGMAGQQQLELLELIFRDAVRYSSASSARTRI